MKRFMSGFALSLFVFFTCSFSCAQNGPTQPQVTLTFTQSTTTSPAVTANCLYRGTSAGSYTLPALVCSSTPTTSFVDSTVVRGTNYHYAVTAKFGTAESSYSNDAPAAVPTLAPPALNPPVETGANKPTDKPDTEVAASDKPPAPDGLVAHVVMNPGK